MVVDSPTASWITDYLRHRPQIVRVGAALSDVVVSDLGAPQGTMSHSESAHLQKFSDDSAVVGCVGGGREGVYRARVSDFVESPAEHGQDQGDDDWM